MTPLGSGVGEMPRREAGTTDRWIVFKLPHTEPEKWATGPRGIGVYADLKLRRRWILFDTLIAAADHARAEVEKDRDWHRTNLQLQQIHQETHP